MVVNAVRLVPGCCVFGSHGPLVINPNASVKQRVRGKVYGTVIKAEGLHKWEVCFDFDGKAKVVTSRSLKLVLNDANIPLNEESEESGVNDGTTASAISTVDTNATQCTAIVPYIPCDGDADPAVQDEIEECEDPVNLEDIAGGLHEGEECLPNNDFCFTAEDFIETRNNVNNATRHQGTYAAEWKIINELEGHKETCINRKDGTVVWKVVPSHSVTRDDFSEVREEEEASMAAINLRVADVETYIEKDDCSKILWDLWPTDIDEDINKLNDAIKIDNLKRKERYYRVIKAVSKGEYIIFHVLLIGISKHSDQGDKLFHDENSKFGARDKKHRQLSLRINFGKYMKHWRYKQIKTYVPQVMESKELKYWVDDWWRFKKRLDEFNETRNRELLTSHVLAFDEIMSTFIPRTTATGDLPNISYVNRKPESLASKFENIVDGLSVKMLWLELQEGKNRMATKECQQERDATAVCVLIGVMATGDNNSRFEYNETGNIFLGDSWFASVKSVTNVALAGHHTCMLVKTAHSRSPKKFLDETMKKFHGGTWITLEGRVQK